MKYCLCKYTNIISEHASEHALDLTLAKCKDDKIYKVLIPDIEVGIKIYLQDRYYGEIIQLTNSLIFIRRPKDGEGYTMMKKSHFEQFFINKTFTIDIVN